MRSGALNAGWRRQKIMNIMHSMYNINIAAYVLFFWSQRIKELNNNSVSCISLGRVTCVYAQIVCRVSGFTFFFSYQSTNLVRTGKLVLFVDEGISAQKYSVFVKFIRLNELSTPIKTWFKPFSSNGDNQLDGETPCREHKRIGLNEMICYTYP